MLPNLTASPMQRRRIKPKTLRPWTRNVLLTAAQMQGNARRQKIPIESLAIKRDGGGEDYTEKMAHEEESNNDR